MLTNDDIFAFRHAPPQAIIPENGFYAATQTRDNLKTPAEEIRTHPASKQDAVLWHGMTLVFETTRFQSNGDSSDAPCHTGTFGVCPICSGFFQRLDRHMLSHTDSRPFSCTKCRESFRQKTHLLRHLETHERMKLFPCSYCGKVLTRKDKLKQHMSRTCKILREY